MIVYLNGKYIPQKRAMVSANDRGFVFSDGVYEVIRSYNGTLFQADAHLKRLERSLSGIRLQYKGEAQLQHIADHLIRENDLASRDAIVYFQITRGAAPRLHWFPPEETPLTMYVCATEFHPNKDALKNGTKVILVPDIRWSRCDIKSIALLPNVLANQQAIEEGATEAIFLRDGVVTEGTHTNFCGIFNGQFLTAPKSNYILAGITRQIVIGLCRILKVPVLEYPIFESQIQKADELMIVGTTSEITPVVRVDDIQIGNGKPGPITKKLQKAFYNYVEKMQRNGSKETSKI